MVFLDYLFCERKSVLFLTSRRIECRHHYDETLRPRQVNQLLTFKPDVVKTSEPKAIYADLMKLLYPYKIWVFGAVIVSFNRQHSICFIKCCWVL